MRSRRALVYFGLAALLAASAIGLSQCAINPQPFPPNGETTTTPEQRDASAAADSTAMGMDGGGNGDAATFADAGMPDADATCDAETTDAASDAQDEDAGDVE